MLIKNEKELLLQQEILQVYRLQTDNIKGILIQRHFRAVFLMRFIHYYSYSLTNILGKSTIHNFLAKHISTARLRYNTTRLYKELYTHFLLGVTSLTLFWMLTYLLESRSGNRFTPASRKAYQTDNSIIYEGKGQS